MLEGELVSRMPTILSFLGILIGEMNSSKRRSHKIATPLLPLTSLGARVKKVGLVRIRTQTHTRVKRVDEVAVLRMYSRFHL